MTGTPVATGTQLAAALRQRGYVADDGLATVISLAVALQRPLLVEGAAGVGKTSLAIDLAAAMGLQLYRLQCHEGLDLDQASYSWDHARQLLALRVMEAQGRVGEIAEDALYDERFLVARPLLQALRAGSNGLLLIDEIDRADVEFEAFLLEFLAEYQITIPELGTVVADQPPIIIITSNRTRELSDALRRRCLYHWIDLPDGPTEAAIIHSRVPDVEMSMVSDVVDVVAALRAAGLYKPPGVAEAIDWVRVLAATRSAGPAEGLAVIDPDIWLRTLGVVVKDHDDLVVARRIVGDRLAERTSPQSTSGAAGSSVGSDQPTAQT